MTTRIIQFSDLHLFADPKATIRGICTRERLDRVLELVRARYANAARFVITGDFTHDESLASYETVRDLIADWFPRLRVVPGNHDNRARMLDLFGVRIHVVAGRNVFVDQVGGWKLIGLDSLLPGAGGGQLGPEQLTWLEQQLASSRQQPVCLFLHHPPIVMHSAWLDRIGLADAAELLAIVERYANVRLICCGHVHQERTAVEGLATILTSPGTGVQFVPETENLQVDHATPGFRVLDLESDGQFRTWVERIDLP